MLQVDERFSAYFSKVKQVFLYLIDECNLDCIHCLYKPNNTFHLKNKQIDVQVARELISYMHELGAKKLTLMGGEPTLYDYNNKRKDFFSLIKFAKEIGYKYIRIDTNGMFERELLDCSEMRLLDEITFSLDGPNPLINDSVRGEGVFDKCVDNIKYAIAQGYNCNITCCIHRGLIDRNSKGELYLDEMIKFAESIGISRINFHDLFKSNLPRDTWTGSIDISKEQWFQVWQEIRELTNQGRYMIPVRIPQGFVTKERFRHNPKYYGYCSAKNGDRVLIHPNGIIRICSLLIGSPYGIARYYDQKIVWDESSTNELGAHDINEYTPCTNQNKCESFEPFVPLCVSFKPQQEEYAWDLLEWEKYREVN